MTHSLGGMGWLSLSLQASKVTLTLDLDSSGNGVRTGPSPVSQDPAPGFYGKVNQDLVKRHILSRECGQSCITRSSGSFHGCQCWAAADAASCKWVIWGASPGSWGQKSHCCSAGILVQMWISWHPWPSAAPWLMTSDAFSSAVIRNKSSIPSCILWQSLA